MTDESKLKDQPSNTDSSGMPSKSTPASGSRIGDPARRGYGDRTDAEPERPGESKGWRFDEETNDESGEGHKGPYASTNSDSDASRPRSDSSSSGSTSGQQSKSGQKDQQGQQGQKDQQGQKGQQGQQQNPGQSQPKSGANEGGRDSGKGSGGKPASTQGGGGTKM